MDGPPDSAATKIIAQERWGDAMTLLWDTTTEGGQKVALINGLAAAERYEELTRVARRDWVDCGRVVNGLISLEPADHPEARRFAGELAGAHGKSQRDNQLSRIAGAQRTAGEYRDSLATAEAISHQQEVLQKAAYAETLQDATQVLMDAGLDVSIRKADRSIAYEVINSAEPRWNLEPETILLDATTDELHDMAEAAVAAYEDQVASPKAAALLKAERWHDAANLCLKAETTSGERREVIKVLASTDRFAELRIVAVGHSWSVIDSLLSQDPAEHPKARREAAMIARERGGQNTDDQLAKVAVRQCEAEEYRDAVVTAEQISDDKNRLQGSTYGRAFHGSLRLLTEAGYRVRVKKRQVVIEVERGSGDSEEKPRIGWRAQDALNHADNERWHELALQAIALYEQHVPQTRPVLS